MLSTLSAEEKEIFISKAKDLITIDYFQESEEQLGPYEWSLKNLSSQGFEVQFAFPNPILVSTGDLLDSVQVTLLKDYFMTIDQELADGDEGSNGVAGQQRRLQTVIDDSHYVKILTEIPLQVRS